MLLLRFVALRNLKSARLHENIVLKFSALYFMYCLIMYLGFDAYLGVYTC